MLDKPFGLRKTLEAVKDAYKSAKYAGIACGIKNVGIGNGMPDIGKSALTVEDADTIHIRTGFTEMGQGLFTLCIQFAVEATGLPPAVFKKVSTDTKFMLDCGQTTASRGDRARRQLDRRSRQSSSRPSSTRGKTLADLVGQTFHRRVEVHVHVEARLRPRQTGRPENASHATASPRRSPFSTTTAGS